MRLASRGLRDMDGGAEMVTDPEELEAIRQQARRVQWRAAVLALLLTALYLALT